MGTNNRKARRKKQQRIIWLISALAVFMIIVIAGCLIALVVKTLGGGSGDDKETSAVANNTQTSAVADQSQSVPADNTEQYDITIEVPTSSEPATASQPSGSNIPDSSAPTLTGDALLDAANVKAAMYDYDAATSMLQNSAEYSSNAKYQEAVNRYAQEKAGLVKWADNTKICHIFFHTLIYDNDLSFDDASDTEKYNKVMTTITEFNRILEQLYERGYVLVNVYDIAKLETMEDGTQKMVRQPIYLPPGKTPIVMSQDDVSYYEYMTGDGYANRLVVQEDGYVTCEMDMPDGTKQRGAFDMIPILDNFVKAHPDFSYRGSKGIIALTGYNGVFGYRTSHYNYGPENEGRDGKGYLYPNPNIDADTETARQVADALKATGWTFACHGWGHRAMGQAELDHFYWDLDLWIAEVTPIIGPCDHIIYPNGDDVGNFWQYTNTEKQTPQGQVKYQYMKDRGFRYFCNVDSNQPWVQITDEYFRQGRLNVDGQRLYEAIVGYRDLLSQFIDPFYVWDRDRPEPVAGVPIPDGYVIGTYSDRT
ncbi:MAG: polysaccharide deacetylase [Lachnospiraceae bacterium]|nr:polysaccharide deacetylase [Lachnospiraceae bacterium]